MKSRRVPQWLATGALAALYAAGCSDNPPQSVGISAGRVEGFVRMGVAPVRTRVRATLVGTRPGDFAQFEADVASDGSYAMDVPAGRYVLGVLLRNEYNVDYEYSASGLHAGDSPPDTLRVDSSHSPVEVDFSLASLRVHLDLSPDLDGEYALVVLHRWGLPEFQGFRYYLFQYRGEIHGGVADFVARGVLPGAYKLEVVLGVRNYLCDCTYDGEHFWMPGVADSSASPSVQLAPNQLAVVEGGVGPTPARIQGRIRGAWEELGIAAPSLSLFALDSTVVRGERPVSDDGSFDERIYLPHPVKLLVTHDGVKQWVGGSTFTAATVFDLEAGHTLSGIDVVESGALVEVTPPREYDFSFLGLRFYDAATMTLAAEWNSRTAPSPDVIPVPNLRPGTYRLHVDFSEHGYSKWAPQWYDRAVDPSDARIVTIGPEGEVVRIPLVMQVGGTISGIVNNARDQTGDIVIYVTQADDPSGWGTRLAHPGQPFTFRGLPDGSWKIGAIKRGNINPDLPNPAPGTVWYPGTPDWRLARAITIRNGEAVTGIEIVLSPARR